MIKKILALLLVFTGVFAVVQLPQTTDAQPAPVCYGVRYDTEIGNTSTFEIPCDGWQDLAQEWFGGLQPGNCYIFSGLGGHPIDCQDVQQRIANQQQQELAQDVEQSLENPNRIECANTADCIQKNKLIDLIKIVVNVFSALVGVVVTIVIIIAGIQYAAAGGNPQTTAAAKKRIVNAIIALVIYLFLFVIFQWLVPGGVLA